MNKQNDKVYGIYQKIPAHGGYLSCLIRRNFKSKEEGQLYLENNNYNVDEYYVDVVYSTPYGFMVKQHRTLLKIIINSILRKFGYSIVSVFNENKFIKYQIKKYPEFCPVIKQHKKNE